MSDDEKKKTNGMEEGDPEEAKVLSELLKKKESKPAGTENKAVFSKKLFGAPSPQPKPPAPKPPAPTPPKQGTPAQPPKTAPIPPRAPQPPVPSAPKPSAPTPKPVPKPSVTQAKPVQPGTAPAMKSPTPAVPKTPSPPASPKPPPPPPVQIEEEEEEVKVVTAEDFDKIGHPPAAPLPDNGLKVEGTGTRDLTTEAFDDEEDFPELVSQPGTAEAAEPVSEETVGVKPAEEEQPEAEEAEPAPVPEAESRVEPASWELESPVDEGVPLEKLTESLIVSRPISEEIPLKPEREPVVLKAAKDKEGLSAIEETKELIEKLDGLDEGFLDVAEVKRGLKLLEELALKVKELEERISALEKSNN